MLSGDKRWLRVSQMMAVHCLLFLEDGCRGVACLLLACSVNPLWPSGAWPKACYPVFTSQEQSRTLVPPLRRHLRLPGDPKVFLAYLRGTSAASC